MASRFGWAAPVVDLVQAWGVQRTVAAAAAALTVVATGLGGYKLVSRSGCDDPIRLSIAATPEIQPAVRAATQDWVGKDPRINDRCVSVDVTAAEAVDVAAAIAGRQQAKLAGVGQAPAGATVPDVWIADSSMWLQRLRLAGPDAVPPDAPSAARSPVVLAMPEPAAASLGWPNATLTWPNLLFRLNSDAKLRPGVVEPTRDAAGLSGLLALVGAANAGGADKGQQAATAGLRALSVGRSTVRADLLARFPRSTDQTALSTSLSAAPLSEQSVIAYNRLRPPVPLAAVYVEPAPAALDYPYAVLPTVDRDKLAAANAAGTALAGDAYRNRLAELGLRAADGSAGGGFPAPKASPAGPAPTGPAPDQGTVEKVLSAWRTVTAPGRLLAVLDVSGSMKTPVPTAGGVTRSAVTVEAARRGLRLLDDQWAVGLWIFSTRLRGTLDWDELVPIGPLSSQREALQAGLNEVSGRVTGGTGLYNTVLAAYKNVQAGWDPGRVNGILVMTDGKNEHAGGLTLARLLAELRRIADPKRPVQVIMLGIGDEVGEAEMKKITGATGGGTFLAPDPSQIGEIFLKAMGLRPNQAQGG
jgi:Ca-activated chloride channel homolog